MENARIKIISNTLGITYDEAVEVVANEFIENRK